MRGRRRCRRWVEILPRVTSFYPNAAHAGIVILRIEELEAIRLVDFLGL
ncbi:MAG: DUF134 domain-containing protein, partial [Thermoplasmata archaeon]|nr:DUF134 domain-containing protein [Thermoplasmata archaeon]